ncbi:glycine cleavage system protein H [Dolosicoccus paucivorans]|uniref:Glycine cleavage system protein H n=1 Tax=Dolosicoccus paucivorans TaxID=84521 RepID=A0A1G8L3A8_9LACT|nr:glycine cleavage system protein H [Dolosicoccus paucivorans]PMB83736.1 glycine cleavage system protein H [Dolosicoccus paucivorans]PMC58650.1 glycine cleavage system protein H [Dolosicoccus paucivorans]SDI50101.1 glycine cleavage system H protein [Dolosicoccus paucivorans]
MQKRANFLFITKQDDIYTLSMTPELQDDLGTVGFVDFTQESHLEEGDTLVNLEAAKSVLELDSPIAGDIIEVNKAAVDNPSLLNSEKEEENWLVKLSNVNEEEFQALEK